MAEGAAPVALFVYNRPDHTRRTVAALRANLMAESTPLYVFSDAAAEEGAREAVREVRELIAGIDGFGSLTIIERERNLGLANSIIDGVCMVCERHGRVVVLEDDLVTSPFFLRYMNDALSLYDNDERVASVSAYMYPVTVAQDMSETVLLEFPMSWGWATWRRGWQLFEPDGRRLMESLRSRGLLGSFDRVGPGSFARMLQAQIDGRNNSWFIRWHASLYLAGRRSLAPTRSLVRNIGLDGTGVHCSQWLIDPYKLEPSPTPVHVTTIPDGIDTDFTAAMERFFRKSRMLRYVNTLYRLLAKTPLRGRLATGRSNDRR